MADVILTDYRLLNLLPRFGMRLGFGEKSVGEVCAKYGVDERFFLLICNIYSSDHYIPSNDELQGVALGPMIDYLKKSHEYYLGNRIAAIEQKLAKTGYPLICQFFAGYKQEVLNHFAYEEQSVFPSIAALGRGESAAVPIEVYEQNHDNIDEKLSDLKNIIVKYLPDSSSVDELNDVLVDIFLFEEDLTQHTRIEDKVLIPYVKTLAER